jgi:hypothetical protein
MADKMTYQEARRIRNKDYSLGSLITQNIRRTDMGAGAAIKEAFREKFDIGTRTKAKITGIKEKFDPLNIAKFLTFGSNVAPALLGRLTGRSKADIANFTGGRAKPYESATKIGRLDSDASGLNEILDKIYTFMKNNQEDDIRHQQLQNNRREEEMSEEAIRHQKLLAALAKLTGNTDGKITAEKVSSGGMSLMDILSSLAFLKDIVGQLLKRAGLTIANGVLSAGRFALGALATPAAAVIAGSVALAGAAKYLQDKQIEKAAERGDKKEVARLLFEQAYPGEAVLNIPPEELPKIYDEIDKLADDVITAARERNPQKSSGTTTEEAAKARSEFAKTDPRLTGALEEPPTATEAAAQARSDFAKTDPRLIGSATEAEAAAGASANLVRATNENNNLKLEDLTSVPTINSVNSSQTNVGKSSNPKQPLPPVRNLEETFQRMILNSTRVV